MAKRITPEQIKQINEIYYQCKVKSQTAKICGVSPSTVTKYLIPNYSPQPQKTYEIELKGAKEFKQKFESFKSQEFADACVLTEQEKQDLAALRKEILW